MGSNAKTSGKWATDETWKCVVINNTRRTRIPFYSNTPWTAQKEAEMYLKSNRWSTDDFELSEPVEVFKKNAQYDETVSFGY